MCNSVQLIVQLFNRWFLLISPCRLVMARTSRLTCRMRMRTKTMTTPTRMHRLATIGCCKWCSLKMPNLVSHVSQWACSRHFATMWFNCSAFCHLTSCEFSAQFLKCFVSASDSTKFIMQFDCCVIDILAVLKVILPRKHHKASMDPVQSLQTADHCRMILMSSRKSLRRSRSEPHCGLDLT